MPSAKLPPVLTRPKTRALAICAVLVAALFAVTAFVPLPFTLTQPGVTVDTLGQYQGVEVIRITGTPTRATTGQLRVTTISATNAGQEISFWTALNAWVRPDQAVLPSEAVYPQDNPGKAVQETTRQMTESQNSATAAALAYLHLSPEQVKVTLDLGDIGGPSAGQMLSLGIIDKIAGDGHGGDLTGGRVVAGTGTIDDQGIIGAVGGIPLKTRAAARDGATVFLVPTEECADAKVDTPAGLRLIPVRTLADAVASLTALNSGRGVPAC
ncbi:hypothetical protein [Kitasatospora sp. NPDC059571]|uniref:hypothetical protein n=1 Tax=Kitasatospora sp. NPDC059571 TaxID=3346871 RepID=UPI00368B39F6